MSMTDPRPDFRAAADWNAALIARVRPDQLDAPTPCEDWTVRDLLGHLVAVLGRVSAIGQGAEPFSVPSMLDGVGDGDWSDRYAEALASWDEVWSDDAVLARSVQAPFGTMPGAAVLGGYISEYLVHGWDLARATGQSAEAPECLAESAYAAAVAKIPADRRGEGVPFNAPITPRPEAGPTEQLANWLGRTS